MENDYRITRYPNTTFAPGDLLLPGDSRRRVIGFFLTGGSGAVYFDPLPNLTDTTSLIQVASYPWFINLSYREWGRLICSEWFADSAGLQVDVAIYEAFII